MLTEEQIARTEFMVGAQDCRSGVPCDGQNTHPEYLRGYAVQYELDNLPAGYTARRVNTELRRKLGL